MRSPGFVSYAQNGEDVVLARALRPDEQLGTWVDIGAADPVVDSVTAAFSERGWRGVNVEPLAREFERLEVSRPRDCNLCLAVGATPGIAKLFAGPPESRGSSTMVPELAECYRDLGQEFRAVEVPVRTLAQIVEEHVTGPVDFLKVDVEGFEREVIAGADWSRFRPRIVVVEATIPNSAETSHGEWEGILDSAGYQFALFDGLNRFYARDEEPELAKLLSVPANVLDDYVPSRWSYEVAEAVDRVERLEMEVRDAAATIDTLAEEHARAWAAARGAQDDATIAGERVEVLRADLAAAQLRTARALEAARASDHQLEGLLATRTFRSTARLRAAYGVVRRALRL